jgi:hypothetical protein
MLKEKETIDADTRSVPKAQSISMLRASRQETLDRKMILPSSFTPKLLSLWHVFNRS